ncbi:unnamed protein product, partial [Mesorhabditis spiculigera]
MSRPDAKSEADKEIGKLKFGFPDPDLIKMRSISGFIFVIWCLAYRWDALNILMYNPGMGHSHMKFMGGMADILTAAGHVVTEIRPLMDPHAKWEGVSKSKNFLHYPIDKEVLRFRAAMENDPNLCMAQLWAKDMTPFEMAKMTENMTFSFARMCERAVFETDLLRGDGMDDCGHGIFEAIGLKTVIAASSMNVMDHQAGLFGIPRHYSYVPGSMGNSKEQMNTWQRGLNMFGSFFESRMMDGVMAAQDAVFKKHLGAGFPDLKDIVARSAILFTNTQPYIEFPRIHKVVDLGGIHIKEELPALTEEWNNVLSKQPKTVLISFGSVAKSFLMPITYKKAIVEAVRELSDVQFIWKYEGDDLSSWDLPENLYLSKWTPQTALLADPRLSLFVSHGGLGSTMEIAYSGKPAIVIPLFADQPRNAQMLKRHEIVEIMSKFDLADSQKLKNAVQAMLNDESAQKKAAHISSMLKHAPLKPKDLLLKNVEFVAKFGSLPQLDPHGRQLSFIQYFLLDVLGALLLCALSILTVVYFVLRRIYRFFVPKTKTKSD